MNGQEIINKARAKAQGIHTVYIPVMLPIKHISANRFTLIGENGPTEFAISSPGATYIEHSIGGDNPQHLNGKKQYEVFPRFSEKPAEWADAVNSFAKNVCPGATFVAIVVNGELYGFPKNYNIVSHEAVLDFVQDENLTPRVTGFSLDKKGKQLDLFIRHKQEGSYEYGITARNGQTGHVTLQFFSYVKIGPKYELFCQDSKVVKHLSRVPEWVEKFEAASHDCIAQEIDEAVKMPYHSAILKLVSTATGICKTDQQEQAVNDTVAELESMVKAGTVNSILDVLLHLSTKLVYGQIPVFRSIMDEVISKALMLYRTA